MVDRGVAKILSEKEARRAHEEPSWYLNHHMVERPEKSSSKLRIVFDLALTYMGVCLNDA